MLNIHQLAYDWSSLFLYVDVRAVLLRLQTLNILSLIFIKSTSSCELVQNHTFILFRKKKKNSNYKIILSIHSRNQSHRKVFYVPMSHKGAFTHLAINTFIRLTMQKLEFPAATLTRSLCVASLNDRDCFGCTEPLRGGCVYACISQGVNPWSTDLFFPRFCRFASSPLGVVEGNTQLCMSVGRERAMPLPAPLTPLPHKRTQIRNTVESVCELLFGWTDCVVRLISRSNVKDPLCDASPNAFSSETSMFAFSCDCTVFVAFMMAMVATCCVLSLVIAELCLLLCNLGHFLEEKRMLTDG